MRRLLDRILKVLNISGRDWVVLVLALLLAFSIWFIHNLSLKYNEYLKVPVSVSSNIDGFAPVSSNSCQVTARCRATGYRIVLSKMRRGGRAVNVALPSYLLVHKAGDEFFVPSESLYEYSAQIFGSGVTVEHFVSDTLFFHFAQENFKKVPVRPVFSLTYSPHYMNDGGVKLFPDSVYVYGEAFRLEDIKYVNTLQTKHYDLESDVRGQVGLKRIRGVRISENKVDYEIDVLRYVEINSVFPVKERNVPPDRKFVIYPSVVNVKQKWRYPLSSEFVHELQLYVDYEDYEQSLSGKCRVELSHVPDGLVSYEIDPPYIECKTAGR